jgi:hypothetical protein
VPFMIRGDITVRLGHSAPQKLHHEGTKNTKVHEENNYRELCG